jgi:hypothetical protein
LPTWALFSRPRLSSDSRQAFAALPLILTASTGILFSILDKQDIKADWLLEIHTGHFGPINLQPYYAYFLELCTLILVFTGGLLWLRFRSHRQQGSSAR